MTDLKIEIFATKEKVYVEYMGACIARLCQLSGEFFEMPDSFGFPFKTHNLYIPKCGFAQFKELVESMYGVKIKNSCKPDWCKK